MRTRFLIAFALLAVAFLPACSTNDGRRLADPDPNLTRVTTTAPTASGEASRGGAAPALAIPVSSQVANGLAVSSTAFAPGAALPIEYTCDGADRAPTVTWAGNEANELLALVVRDADAGGTVHWLITDLRAASGNVDDSPSSPGTVRVNGFGNLGWTGPCPENDLDHRYVFALYTLPRPLVVAPDADAASVVRAIEESHTSAATVLATYTRA